jgi:hypothetical protein
MNKLNSPYALAPTNVNKLIRIVFSVIICRFGNARTANETLLHDRRSQHNVTCGQAGMYTPDSKTDMIINTHSMSQRVFHLM